MCNTVKKFGCCPLNYNCDKPLTKECWTKCLNPLIEESREEEGKEKEEHNASI